MTQEQLNSVNPRAGRPRLEWTNEKWQEYFEILKCVVASYPQDIKKLTCATHKIVGGEEYKGDTCYQQYCSYINSTLTSIRLGTEDYCYYIYQITELLKFHKNLKTEYVNDHLNPYFRIWL